MVTWTIVWHVNIHFHDYNLRGFICIYSNHYRLIFITILREADWKQQERYLSALLSYFQAIDTLKTFLLTKFSEYFPVKHGKTYNISTDLYCLLSPLNFLNQKSQYIILNNTRFNSKRLYDELPQRANFHLKQKSEQLLWNRSFLN